MVDHTVGFVVWWIIGWGLFYDESYDDVCYIVMDHTVRFIVRWIIWRGLFHGRVCCMDMNNAVGFVVCWIIWWGLLYVRGSYGGVCYVRYTVVLLWQWFILLYFFL